MKKLFTFILIITAFFAKAQNIQWYPISPGVSALDPLPYTYPGKVGGGDSVVNLRYLRYYYRGKNDTIKSFNSGISIRNGSAIAIYDGTNTKIGFISWNSSFNTLEVSFLGGHPAIEIGRNGRIYKEAGGFLIDSILYKSEIPGTGGTSPTVVNKFNTRSGNVTLTAADIIAAIGNPLSPHYISPTTATYIDTLMGSNPSLSWNGIKLIPGALSGGVVASGADYNINNLTHTLTFSATTFTSFTGVNILVLPSNGYSPGLMYPNSPWAGKTILWIGTSKPATPYAGGYTYPALVCQQLGATLINNAVDSSPVRDANSDGTYTGIQYPNLIYALDDDTVTKSRIIKNWLTIYPTLASTPAPPTTLDTATRLKMKNSSYQNLWTPYFDGRVHVDAIMLDHGWNDLNRTYKGDTAATFYTNPANLHNKGTFIGGWHWLIDMADSITQAHGQPPPVFVMVGTDENQIKPAVSLAQQAIADYYNMPFIKLWEKAGLSQAIVKGSVTNWSIAPWNAYTTTGYNLPDITKDMTVHRIRYPDDIHESSDPTGRAVIFIANIIANSLFNIRF